MGLFEIKETSVVHSAGNVTINKTSKGPEKVRCTLSTGSWSVRRRNTVKQSIAFFLIAYAIAFYIIWTFINNRNK